MKSFNESKTIEAIEKYIGELEKETGSKPYKPFFTVYVKKRHSLNPLKYIFGDYKIRWFEKDRQPNGYKNAFELFTESINLDVKDITFIKK